MIHHLQYSYKYCSLIDLLFFISFYPFLFLICLFAPHHLFSFFDLVIGGDSERVDGDGCVRSVI